MLMHFTAWQWGLGAVAALFVGITKTGIPGAGILVVPLLANAFGGVQALGVMLPMLIFGDCFAVLWYKRHAQWDKILSLLPWVVVGMAVGSGALWAVGHMEGHKGILDKIIGTMVLIMLALYLLQGRLGGRLTPKSRIGTACTGVAAGFATAVSNAAGSIMSIYMAAQQVTKEQFMGTLAWYYFILNLSKVPIYIYLTLDNPAKPVYTPHTLLFNLLICPLILVGVFIGKWMLPRISQEAFEKTVLVLAAAASVKLIIG